MIDAHAGALGALGGTPDDPDHQLALIAGTSTCLMALSAAPRFEPGFWGPYRDVVIPGRWMIEGGQSASGALLDHICSIWGGAEPDAAFHGRVCARIAELRAREGWGLARRLNVLPDFAGNRSPHADPAALGVISGLTLDRSFDGLCRLYWRTAVGLASGIRQVVDRLVPPPAARPRLHVAGGHARNPMLLQLYADATGCVLDVAEQADAVLLGSAMVAATAAGEFTDLRRAARMMTAPVREIVPDAAARSELDIDYRIFLEMHEQRRRIEHLATGAEVSAKLDG
jgi:ribulose kinase